MYSGGVQIGDVDESKKSQATTKVDGGITKCRIDNTKRIFVFVFNV